MSVCGQSDGLPAHASLADVLDAFDFVVTYDKGNRKLRRNSFRPQKDP